MSELLCAIVEVDCMVFRVNFSVCSFFVSSAGKPKRTARGTAPLPVMRTPSTANCSVISWRYGACEHCVFVFSCEFYWHTCVCVLQEFYSLFPGEGSLLTPEGGELESLHHERLVPVLVDLLL